MLNIDLPQAARAWALAESGPAEAVALARMLLSAAKRAGRLQHTLKGENALRDAVAACDVALDEQGINPELVAGLEAQALRSRPVRQARRRA